MAKHLRYENLTAIANSFRVTGVAQQIAGVVWILGGPATVWLTRGTNLQTTLNARFPPWAICVAILGVGLGVRSIRQGIVQAGYGEALLALADIAVGSTATMPEKELDQLRDRRSIGRYVLGIVGLGVMCVTVVVGSATIAKKYDNTNPAGHTAATGAPSYSSSTKSCPADMTGIPAGSYELGDTKQPVTVAAYCLDLTEVTVQAYGKCVDAGACTEPGAHVNKAGSPSQFCNWKNPGREQHPVNCVDWNQSVIYCDWAKKRLPTEEEWEWAARNGDKGDTYPWGSTTPDGSQANACGSKCASNLKTKMWQDWPSMYPPDDGWPETAPVASFPKGDNRFGAHDLAGNVWEWTSSKFSVTSLGRVGRGGSWHDGNAAWIAASSRLEVSPSTPSDRLGFRCVNTL